MHVRRIRQTATLFPREATGNGRVIRANHLEALMMNMMTAVLICMEMLFLFEGQCLIVTALCPTHTLILSNSQQCLWDLKYQFFKGFALLEKINIVHCTFGNSLCLVFVLVMRIVISLLLPQLRMTIVHF